MKKTIRLKSILMAFTLPIIANYSCAQNNNKNHFKDQNSKSILVLELFTSQSCSSCPPADAVLSDYVIEQNANVIALAFHVDYWNRLGWKDPFSKTEFSERQREYAQIFNSRNVYTPQIVINGKYELVGSKKNEIAAIVAKEIKLTKKEQIFFESITLINNLLSLKVNSLNPDNNNIINIALVKKKEFTNIKRGENSGLQQINHNIVFDFKSISEFNNDSKVQTFYFNNNWNSADFVIVAFIQNKKTGSITDAIQSDIN